jgi:putative transposase
VVEIIYEKLEIDLGLDKGRIVGIDLGITNLITAVNNIGLTPFVIKGGVAKSINQFYNKQRAYYQSLKDSQGYQFETKRLRQLTLKRNSKIRNFFHKVSRQFINYCILGNFGTIIIGYNEKWKQYVSLGKRHNQNFVQIPFVCLIQMIRYKAKLVGIEVIEVEENYTSLCSFFDNESIAQHHKYMGTRISRGLFQTYTKSIVNADVNAGYNIIRKAVPNAFADGIADVVGHPISVSIQI